MTKEPPLLGSVELPAMLHDDVDTWLWPALLELSERIPEPWVLVGGQMVFLHGLVAGRRPPRTTRDVDVIFDVRAQVQAMPQAVEVLKQLGYAMGGISPEGLGHRFIRPTDGMEVDILAPDNLGPRAEDRLLTDPPGRTIEVRGGGAALQYRHALHASYGGRTATIYIPDLPRALGGKIHALFNEHPGSKLSEHLQSRHLSDIAFLVSLIDDPDEFLAHRGTQKPPPRHADLAVLDDPAHHAWAPLEEFAEDAHLAWMHLRHG
ncbi:nucleotidyl transferase AbiEii/AbiGii toxin family protein [Saccharopolyspora hattusasensis]|uniref:nucleotidyl transferase AbiEii/AbiGii toxin family protein n=1 Tax=Saccharopolyspora hattusasensis TaxID=1128679 RepID=UPI003D973834